MEIFVNPRQARKFNGFHPWVLASSIVEPTVPLPAGQQVELVTPGGWIGRGIYNPHSRIRVRLYQWVREAPLDEGWLHGRLQQAVALRRDWMQRHQPLDAVRWVNSEGDGLSGLIVDQFGEFIVIQLTALAMAGWESSLVGWISETLRPGGILLRVDASTAKAEGLAAREELVFGALPVGPIEIDELGVKLRLDPRSGQKTGSYLDQRSNRRLAADWIGDGPMLDVCCYHGGFALAAHRWARPSRITAVDSSLKALTQAEMNAQLNGADIDFVQADCFDYLSDLCETDAAFDTVVLDPPRMAAQRSQISAALRAYYRLNLSAVRLLRPGGTLITCSCTGRVSRSDFIGLLASVAHRARRNIQIVESRGADFDHPVMAHCPEGEYLKCLICRVY